MSDETFQDDEYIGDVVHYGIKRRSGRYPWGSGGHTATPYGRAVKFSEIIADIKKSSPGIKEKEIIKAMGLDELDDPAFTINALRATTTIAKETMVQEETHRVKALAEKGMSVDAIAKQLDLSRGKVRLRLKNADNLKKSMLTGTADTIQAAVDKYGIVDIGKATNLHLGVSPEKLRASVALLIEEGYVQHPIKIQNVGTRNKTTYSVLTPPGTTFQQAYKMRDNIHVMAEWTEDGGITYFGIRPPISLDPKRLQVRYREDGGSLEDGVLYVRRGVEDLSLGKNNYAQVRVKVGDSHFIKGMAIATDDMPPGVDVVFNTDKKRGTPVMGTEDSSVLKLLKDDPDNPFGSMISRQILETDPNTGETRATSVMNMVNEEGDWDGWRKSIPAQMLSKQPHTLIESQLDTTRKETVERLSEIMEITNPVIKKDALMKFADEIDSDAVELRAASMPGQQTQVILPVTSLPPNEIYAPSFNTGDRVVVIRFPHGGQFEIPELIVNNNRRKAKSVIGNAPDAVGIHPSVAERLSGADFDGDTVLVIPNPQGQIKGIKSLGRHAKVYDDALNNFDPKYLYGGYKVVGTNAKGQEVGNFPLMTNTGLEMGRITNLITDMQTQGADPEHVIRAVKHSMVVIDAEKHRLDYKQSAEDRNIAQLKELYQRGANSGATTLLSRATAKTRIPEIELRKARDGGPIDPETGKLQYVETGAFRDVYDPKTKTYMDGKDGRPKIQEPKQSQVKRLAATDDAYDLVRDPSNPVERLYADHANAMKAYANETRRRAMQIQDPKRSPTAAKVYEAEVAELKATINKAQATKPLERKANVIARRLYVDRLSEDPLLRLDHDRRKKVERQIREGTRARMGLKRPVITPSDKQWDAIQAGAVSTKMLRDMMEYADDKRIRELSMPRANTVMTSAISARAAAMLRAGKTNKEIAMLLGVPPSTLKAAIKRGDV